MSNHVFRCGNAEHVIFDVSEEPVPHIGVTEQIYCPTCGRDVSGVYLGQAINFETGAIGDTLPEEEVKLYEENGQPYCIHCDGVCQK